MLCNLKVVIMNTNCKLSSASEIILYHRASAHTHEYTVQYWYRIAMDSTKKGADSTIHRGDACLTERLLICNLSSKQGNNG